MQTASERIHSNIISYASKIILSGEPSMNSKFSNFQLSVSLGNLGLCRLTLKKSSDVKDLLAFEAEHVQFCVEI